MRDKIGLVLVCFVVLGKDKKCKQTVKNRNSQETDNRTQFYIDLNNMSYITTFLSSEGHRYLSFILKTALIFGDGSIKR